MGPSAGLGIFPTAQFPSFAELRRKRPILAGLPAQQMPDDTFAVNFTREISLYLFRIFRYFDAKYVGSMWEIPFLHEYRWQNAEFVFCTMK